MASVIRNFIFLLFAVALFCSCDNTIDPLQENELYYFSIYGYMDISEDTNWVRVMPVRDTVFLPPRPIDATVTLEHVGSGQTTIMNDSLFRYGADAYAYNYWTTVELLPAETYRLTASRSDGKKSTATVTFPPDFPLFEVNDLPQDFNSVDYIYVFDVERLAFAEVIYEIVSENPAIESGRTVGVSQLDDYAKTGYGYEIRVDPVDDTWKVQRMLGLGTITLNPLRVEIAAAGSDWPDFANLDEEDLALPDGVSNIDMGVGFLAPIIKKSVPYE